jgi:pyruvate dehydrogenase E1 component
MFYKEDKKGQMLEEGINEAGATCSWIAAGTAYANHKQHMVPFYIYYSMFGFQRVGDFIWAAGDIQARGFLLGATAGRTTLAGEGLQHQDGHSQIVATTVPNCRAYDPAYAYELAVIIHDGMKRMYTNDENIFYYLSVMNENYVQPAMPAGAEEGILKGAHQTAKAARQAARNAAGFGHHPARGAGRPRSRSDYRFPRCPSSPASANCAARHCWWSARACCIRKGPAPYVELLAARAAGHRATSNMRLVPRSAVVPGRYVTLGTDGFTSDAPRCAITSRSIAAMWCWLR